MDNTVTAIQSAPVQLPVRPEAARVLPRGLAVHGPKDTLELGKKNKVSTAQAQNVLLERAYNKLKSVVDQARADLGIPEGAVIDTSPEATADRIVEFALGAFQSYWGSHPELGEEEARGEFAAFIGAAIGQGIDEARGILGALNALNPEVDGNIDKTAAIIEQRLNDFIENGFESIT